MYRIVIVFNISQQSCAIIRAVIIRICQLDGEGIRYEIVDFLHRVNGQKKDACIDKEISIAISKIMKEITEGIGTFELDKDI